MTYAMIQKAIQKPVNKFNSLTIDFHGWFNGISKWETAYESPGFSLWDNWRGPSLMTYLWFESKKFFEFSLSTRSVFFAFEYHDKYVTQKKQMQSVLKNENLNSSTTSLHVASGSFLCCRTFSASRTLPEIVLFTICWINLNPEVDRKCQDEGNGEFEICLQSLQRKVYWNWEVSLTW